MWEILLMNSLQISNTKMLIGTIIPNNFHPSWEFVRCLIQASKKYDIVHTQGPYIYENRNNLLDMAKYKNESILMIDSDIVFTLNQVECIERHLENVPAVTGVYVFGIGELPMLFKKNVGYELTSIPETFSPIDACGGGFLGFSKELVQKLPNKAFNAVFENGTPYGEDISVCHRINELGFKIYCDPELVVGHIRQNVMYPK